MWLVEGAFDQISGVNLEQKKLKLLKPGRTYPLGRKQKQPLQLVLAHPKISGEHITLSVGSNSVEVVSDPTFRPTLKIQNHRNKALQVSRTANGSVARHLIQPMSEDEVLPGDCIALVTGIYINVHWRPICCLLPPKSLPISFDKCASLGVKVVSTPRPEVTHHLTPTLSVTASLATSLINLAHIVRPEWLNEVMHLGTELTPDGPSTLELDFRLPIVSQYTPAVGPGQPAQLKSPTVFEPNERRVGMLKGWRLLFVGEKGREVDTETRTLVERGGGEYEVFDVSGGLTRWKQALSRNKRKAQGEGGKGLGVLADTESLQIAVGDAWDSMVDELKKFELCFVSRSKLLEAVFFVDTSRINSHFIIETEKGSVTSDSALNAYGGEPSPNVEEFELASRNGLTNRNSALTSENEHVESQAGAQAEQAERASPAAEPDSRGSVEPDSSTGRRRPLIRRAKTNATQDLLLGVDDPAFASFTVSQSPATQSKPADDAPSALPVESQILDRPVSSTAATGRSTRLKKRARVDKGYNPILASLEEQIAEATLAPSDQPPLKRFRALFEETDPDRVASQFESGANSGGILESQTFSQVESETTNDVRNGFKPALVPLVPIREEEEGESLRTNAQERMETDNEVAGDAAQQHQTQLKSASKASGAVSQRHTTPFDSTQAPKRSKSHSGGAAPGKPDTDAAFLQALASTKKGKRKEDDFDREFNNLRISKPEHDHDAEAEDWRVLADFGDESNIRGNFMVIVEMEVPDKPRDSSRGSSVVQNRGPDFKKFKKKVSVRQHPSVELVAADESDYGMGAAYWKGSQSQGQSQGEFGNIPEVGLLQPSQTQNRGFLQPKPGPSTQSVKPHSRSQVKTDSKAAKMETQGGTQKALRGALRVPEADDEEGDDDIMESRMTRGTRTTAGGKGRPAKSQALFLSDVDEDEGIQESTGSVGKPKRDEDGEEFQLDLDLDEVDMSDDEPAPPTLRSTAPSSLRSASVKPPVPSPKKRAATSKKRSAALSDDSDTGMTFKGFGGKKRMRAK